MTIKDRLDLVIRELGVSGRGFERECGLANGSYASLGDGVGADKLNKILIRYSQISADWLLTGQGGMLKKTDIASNDSSLTDGQFKYFVDKLEAQAKEIGRLEHEIENLRK